MNQTDSLGLEVVSVPSEFIDKYTKQEYKHKCGHYRVPVIGYEFEADLFDGGWPQYTKKFFIDMAHIGQHNEHYKQDYRFSGIVKARLTDFGRGNARKERIKEHYAGNCPACSNAIKNRLEAIKAKRIQPMRTPVPVPIPAPTAPVPAPTIPTSPVSEPTAKKIGRPKGSRTKKEVKQDQSIVSISIERNGQSVQWTGSMSEYTSVKKVRTFPAVHTCGHTNPEVKEIFKGLRKELFYDKYVEVYSHVCPLCAQDVVEEDSGIQNLPLALYPEQDVKKPIIMSAIDFMNNGEEDGEDKELVECQNFDAQEEVVNLEDTEVSPMGKRWRIAEDIRDRLEGVFGEYYYENEDIAETIVKLEKYIDGDLDLTEVGYEQILGSR